MTYHGNKQGDVACYCKSVFLLVHIHVMTVIMVVVYITIVPCVGKTATIMSTFALILVPHPSICHFFVHGTVFVFQCYLLPGAPGNAGKSSFDIKNSEPA